MKIDKQKILEELQGRGGAGYYLWERGMNYSKPSVRYMNAYDDELNALIEPRKAHHSLIEAAEEAILKIRKGRKLLLTISFDLREKRGEANLKIVPRSKIDAMIIDYLMKND